MYRSEDARYRAVMNQSRELPYPHTDMIVSALLVLGVEGPASAQDVMNAAGLNLPARQVAEVLNAVTAARANRVDPTETGSTGSGDPDE